MKNIFILFLLATVFSYGQIKDTTIVISKKNVIIDYNSNLKNNELQKYFDDFKKEYLNSSNKASSNIVNILNSIPITTNPCENGGFESNDPYSSWTGLALKHGSTAIPIENGLITDPGIQAFTLLNSTASYGKYIQFQTLGTDSNLLSATPSTTLQHVVSGTQSLRLGNNSAGFAAEGIAKRFVVTPLNAKLYFQYAVVMDKSHSSPDGSINGSEVFFIAEAVDMSGATIDKIVDIGNPSNPFISAVSGSWATNGPPNNMYYRNWRCAYLDLTNKIGQEVVVFFINSDCSAGAHKGYTYLDAVCETCVDVNEGDININLDEDNCLDFPQQIGGTFVLPASGNSVNENITLEIYQNNVLVTTLTSPTISGGNYYFTLNASDFPNQDSGQCYDLVSVLTFQIPDMNNNLQTVTQYSSKVVNGVQDGEIPGINNDVCFCDDPEPCCDIEDFDASIKENNGSFNVTINGGSVPIQEVEISMIDYHVEYSNVDCKPDDMGNFGTLSTSTTTLGNLLLNAGDNNTSNLTWLPGSPGILNGGVNLNIIDPLILNLDCCDVVFSFCLKVRVKDVNCNVCEKIICYTSKPIDDPCEIEIKDIDQDKKYCPGDSITINWSGSTPSGFVNVSLFDNTNASIYQVLATGIPNTGVFTYTIPAGIPCDPPRSWSLIVEDSEKLCVGRSNKFTIECCDDDCSCGEWLTSFVTIKEYLKEIPQDPKLKINFQSNFTKEIDCGGAINLKPTFYYSFTAPNYVCNPENCDVSYKWEVVNSSGVIQAGVGKTFNYNFSSYGNYQVVFTPICGGEPCEPCIINVNIKKIILHNPDPIIGIPYELPTKTGDVTNPKTGETWMNKNLGATRVATSPTDAAAFGDLYQWGRLTDGHEKRTSNTTTTLSNTNVPGNGNFIKASAYSNDWRSPSNNNLWQGLNGINNPCPTGYRLPTEAELDAERLSWTSNNSAGAFASPLKWTLAGQRVSTTGSIQFAGNNGFYWSSTANNNFTIASAALLFANNNSQTHLQYSKGTGMSCRCIKN